MTRASRRASVAPMQKWMPRPKAKCGLDRPERSLASVVDGLVGGGPQEQDPAPCGHGAVAEQGVVGCPAVVEVERAVDPEDVLERVGMPSDRPAAWLGGRRRGRGGRWWWR